MPPFLLPTAHNFPLLLFLLPMLLPIPSAAAPCNASQVSLITEAFQSVRGLNTSLLSSPTFLNCSADGAIDLHLPSRNLSGSVHWMRLANLTGLRVVNLSGNALEGSIPPGFFSSASSLLHLDLSNNKLGGVIRLNSTPVVAALSPLLSLNLSRNHFTNQPVLSGFSELRELDMSRNDLRAVPEGIEDLKALEYLDLSRCNISRMVGGPKGKLLMLGKLKHLDLSGNGMNGSFPADFPPLKQLLFLNVSGNNFSGEVGEEQATRFGPSAFVGSGVRIDGAAYARPPAAGPGGGMHRDWQGFHKNESSKPGKYPQQEISNKQVPVKKEKKALVLGLAIGGAAVLLATAGIASVACCCLYRRRKRERKRKQWTIAIPGTWKATRRGGKNSYHSSTQLSSDPEAAWVLDASVSAPSAPLVMFEKPLMELTFSDMVAATSGFGHESQLAEGRVTGPVYRAVLPGDMDVAVKVLVRARGIDEAQAKASVLELAGLKHHNLLPLLGYCVAGKEKLLLYQYMENGDLHRWLHELPLAAPVPSARLTDEWTAGPADGAAGVQSRATGTAWASRYRIALGVARGLAFLHHAASGTPIVHGNVEASNVFLDETLEPRVAGLWPRSIGGSGRKASVADDVFGYGVVLLELLTGRVGSRDEVGRIRGMFKSGTGPSALDPRVLDGSSESEEAEEKEMVEALRVAYLCTADPAEKRPSMRQVVGLLKDIRPLAV